MFLTCADTGSPPATSQQSPFVRAIAVHNTRIINGKFSKLVTKSCKRLQTKGINIKEVQVFLITMYSSPNSRDGIDTITTVIKSAESLNEIFVGLGEYGLWDYLNYDLLQDMIEVFASDDDELNGMMDQYMKDLTGYLLTCEILKYLEATHPSATTSDSEDSDGENVPLFPPQQKRMFFKELSIMCQINVTDHTLRYVTDLWRSLKNQFKLPSLRKILRDFAEGNIAMGTKPSLLEIESQTATLKRKVCCL